MQEPGFVLDSDIARKIWRSLVIFEDGEHYLVGIDGAKVELPKFSTNLPSAQRIISWFQANGFVVKATHDPIANVYHVCFIKPTSTDTTTQFATAPTLPHAICIAALTALDRYK